MLIRAYYDGTDPDCPIKACTGMVVRTGFIIAGKPNVEFVPDEDTLRSGLPHEQCIGFVVNEECIITDMDKIKGGNIRE